MRLLLGIDIGTQGTKTAVFTEDGTCLGDALVSSRPHKPSPGSLEEDANEQVEAVLATIRQCLQSAKV